MWSGGYIAVDWGTTNRRAYRIGPDGGCDAEFEDEKGILSVKSGGFPRAVAEIRARLGDQPLMMGGMVGSNRGWVEAPYVPCPAGPETLAEHLVVIDAERAAIVPGLSYLDGNRADVMRGEEVQLFGAAATDLVPADCLVCHPGTHNKWVQLAGGRVTSFRTVMTGELFNLLRERSILSDLLVEDVVPGAAFRDGVRRGLSRESLSAQLFSVRAEVLLGQRPRSEAASFTSGLLIGDDIRAGLADVDHRQIIVMGRPELTQLYVAALEEAGRSAREVDGERAFIAGIREIVRQVR